MAAPLSDYSDVHTIASKTKKGFEKVRGELKEMKHSLEGMRSYLSRQKQDYISYKKGLDSRNSEFQEGLEEFSAKLVKIKVLLSEITALRKELVIKRDLSKIEERMKRSFRKEIAGLQKQLDAVLARPVSDSPERGEVEEKGWFWNRKKKKKTHGALAILEKEGKTLADSKPLDEEKRVWTAEELQEEISGESEDRFGISSQKKKSRKKKAKKK